MILNSKQKPLCPLATAELFPNDIGKQQQMTKARLGLMPWFLVYPTTRSLISLASWSLTAQAKGPFQNSKELKMN